MSLSKKQIKTVREAFENSTGQSLRLADEAINAVCNSPQWVELDDATDDENAEEKQMAILAKAQEAFKGIAVSDPGISGLVAKLDDPFYAELDTCIEAFIKGKTSTVDIFGQFKRTWTKEQFDATPFPGTDKDDVKGTNYKPDIVEKKAVSGGMVRTVFTDDLVFATTRGKAFQVEMDECTAELKVTGSVKRLSGKSKQALRDMFNIAKQQRDAMRKMFRGAIALHHQLSAVEMMPKVDVSWIPGTNDKCPVIPKTYGGKEMFKVSRSPRPLWLKALEDGKEVPNSGKEISVTQLLAYNPAKALLMPEGGTMGNLIDSAKGEPETPEQVGEMMTEETMDTTVVVINAKLQNVTARAALRKRAQEPDQKEMLMAYCNLYLNLKGFYDANQKKYEEYLDSEEKTAKKEQKSEAA